MAWNSKAPSEQDWESVSLYIAKATEVPKRLQSSNHEIEGDGGVDSGSVYSSGGVGFYSSELGHGSSSKSFISTSANSSSMEGVKTFTTVDTSPKDFSATNEFSKVDSGGNFPRLEASIGSCEPMIGLNLGKRIYFENICTASTSNVSSLSLISTSSAAATKRSRTSYQRTQTPHCQVEGCNLDLRSAKDYHRRHRICESHSKSPKVIVAGMERRFCQQCSRFHDLSEFDDKKRSCRRRLFDHNARRRRPQPDPIQFKSAVLSSSLYGERQPMNYVLNRGPVPAANSTWQAACSFMVTPGSGSLLGSGKVGGIGRQLHLPADEMSNAISTLHFDSHGVSSFKGGTNHVLDQGLAANAIASNLDAAPDRQRALSLLSNNSWGLNDHKPSSLEQLMHANQASVSQAVLHAESQSWAVSSSECLQDEQLSSEKNRGSSQFQEFQLFKAPYDIGCFYSNQIN